MNGVVSLEGKKMGAEKVSISAMVLLGEPALRDQVTIYPSGIEAVQKLIAGGHLLVGQVGVQGQGNGCIGQIVRLRFVDHLKGGSKVGFPQKTNALGHFNTGAGAIIQMVYDRQAKAGRVVHPCVQHAIIRHNLRRGVPGNRCGRKLCAPDLRRNGGMVCCALAGAMRAEHGDGHPADMAVFIAQNDMTIVKRGRRQHRGYIKGQQVEQPLMRLGVKP
jgi:hypothetical protein